MGTNPNRLDKTAHKPQYDRNKKKILASQSTCGICGKPVDKSLKWPHPMCATIDHIIPISKGGHPSDIDNLQLAHWCCNRAKADDLNVASKSEKSLMRKPKVVTNRNLPLSMDWTKYGGMSGSHSP